MLTRIVVPTVFFYLFREGLVDVAGLGGKTLLAGIDGEGNHTRAGVNARLVVRRLTPCRYPKNRGAAVKPEHERRTHGG